MGSNLYVKLDASYDDDPKILLAGEKAEVLYLRGLCLAKRILSDGFIADVHLPRFGLSGVQSRAKKLVEVGLWERAEGGYLIRAWLKHNSSRDEVEAIKEGGARGNHVRWHVRERKPSADCPMCIADGLAPPSPPDSPPDSPGRVPEAEAEAEAENKPSSTDVDPAKGFEEFWQVWPKRNGKKIGKQDALRKWKALPLPERRAAYIGARHYAAASDAGMAGAMDAFRWLEKRRWEDWQEPAGVADEGRRGGVTVHD